MLDKDLVPVTNRYAIVESRMNSFMHGYVLGIPFAFPIFFYYFFIYSNLKQKKIFLEIQYWFFNLQAGDVFELIISFQFMIYLFFRYH